jgi:hypothetical protein
LTSFGPRQVGEDQLINQAPGGFTISPYLQDLALQLGQEFAFQQAGDWLSKLAKLDLNAKQIASSLWTRLGRASLAFYQ